MRFVAKVGHGSELMLLIQSQHLWLKTFETVYLLVLLMTASIIN